MMIPLPLPQIFNENEWFVIVVLVVSFSILRLLPKRFPLSITILIMLFSSITARLHDHLLSSPSLDLYDIMDTARYEVFDVLTYILYAPFAYIFIYFYNKYNIRGLGTWVYILVCSFCGTIFEGLTVVFEIFNYKGWKLTYSFSVYLVTQSLTLLMFHFVKRYHESLTTK